VFLGVLLNRCLTGLLLEQTRQGVPPPRREAGQLPLPYPAKARHVIRLRLMCCRVVCNGLVRALTVLVGCNATANFSRVAEIRASLWGIHPACRSLC
jgi:hypothetical protein